MSKQNNDGKNSTSGFGTVELVQTGTAKADPGARIHNNADWVKQDREYKEALPQIKYS